MGFRSSLHQLRSALRKDSKHAKADRGKVFILSENSPFSVQEAYKTLRTNIIFSFPQQEGCKSIVLTSSVQGEAKSTTAVNLAIAFAQNSSRILLMDCDLRLPTDTLKLGINQKEGLTNVMVGMSTLNQVIVKLPNGLDVLPAGDIPPNPTELLGSDVMQKILETLSTRYDYIIMDAPPICAVTDAALLAKIATGAVVIARHGVSTRESIEEALSKLKFTGAKIIGFVYTGAENEKLSGKRKKGYYGYGYGYGYGYAQSQQRAAENARGDK